jgi:hypothetical protein
MFTFSHSAFRHNETGCDPAEVVRITLGRLLELDPSLGIVTGLSRRWQASRKGRGYPWMSSEIT